MITTNMKHDNPKHSTNTPTLPLVAIDLGSNEIRAMAAQRVGPNTLKILGVERSQRQPCMDRGIVVQSSSAGFMIKEVLQLLGNRIGVKDLPTAFTLLGGRTVKTAPIKSKRDQGYPRPITEALLDEMEKECKQKTEANNPEVAVLGLFPLYFVLDGKEQNERPQVTQTASVIEAHYMAFVGCKATEQKVTDSFNHASKVIEQAFVRPDALLSAFANEDDTILTDGCAIIDFGAQTTTLTIYKGNQYLLNKVVSCGGWNITRLIEQQGFSFGTAEKLKCTYGFASPAQVKTNQKITIRSANYNETITVTTDELAQAIQLKLDEAVNPLMEILASYEHRIKALFITGGGSMLQGLDEYLQSKTSVPVLFGSHASLLTPLAKEEYEYYKPTYSALVGALILGADYRDTHRELSTDNKSKFIEQIEKLKHKMTGTTLALFTEQDY